MSSADAKSIVAFTTDYFDRSWPEDGSDPNVPPLGKDAAAYFRRRLSEFGVQVVGSDAVMGEAGWHWDVSIGRDDYGLVVHWAPLGKPPKDYWIIQISKHVGLLPRLLGKKGLPSDVMPVVTVLRRIIDAEPKFGEVRWFTPEEFRVVY
jgi:hypothetical protein